MSSSPAPGRTITTLADAFDRGVFQHSKLPPHMRRATSIRDFSTALQQFYLDRCVPFADLPRHVRDMTQRSTYAKAVLTRCRDQLRLYPYALIDDAVQYGHETPLEYYTTILSLMLKKEWQYDALPNFTAVDILRHFGIGRNQYIELANSLKGRTAKWLLKGAYVNDVIPRRLAPTCLLNPAWIVRPAALPGDVVEERLTKLVEEETVEREDPAPKSVAGITPPNAYLVHKHRAEINKRVTALMKVYVTIQEAAAADQSTASKAKKKPERHLAGTVPSAATATQLAGSPAQRIFRACEFARSDIQTLYMLGLVYPVIEVGENDVFAVPPFEGFVMNRTSQDWQERILYDALAAIDERRSLQEHAQDLAGSLADTSFDASNGPCGGPSESSANLEGADERSPNSLSSPAPVAAAAPSTLEAQLRYEQEATLDRLLWAVRVLSQLGLVKQLTPKVSFRKGVVVPVLGAGHGSAGERTQGLLDGVVPRHTDPAAASDSRHHRRTPSTSSTSSDEGRGSRAASTAVSASPSVASLRTMCTVDPSWESYIHELMAAMPASAPPLVETASRTSRDPASVAMGDEAASLDDANSSSGGEGRERRVCVLYDGPMAGRVMIAAQGAAHRQLKKAAVTMFEAGKLSHRFVEGLLPLLEPIHADYLLHHSGPRDAVPPEFATTELPPPTQSVTILCQHETPAVAAALPLDSPAHGAGGDEAESAAQHEQDTTVRPPASESAAIFSYVSNLYLLLKSLLQMDDASKEGYDVDEAAGTSDGHGRHRVKWEVDLVRVEHLNQLRPHVREGLLTSRYSVAVALGPLTVVPAVDARRLEGRTHLIAPTMATASSAWLRMFIAAQLKAGPAMLALPRGVRVSSLPRDLLDRGGVHESAVDATAVRSAHAGYVVETLARADNNERRVPAHSVAFHVARAAREDSILVTRAASFDAPLLLATVAFSASDDAVRRVFSRAGSMLYTASDTSLAETHKRIARGAALDDSAVAPLFDVNEDHVEAFTERGLQLVSDITRALRLVRGASTLCGVLRLECSIDRGPCFDAAGHLRHNPLTLRLASLEFGVPLDPAGFDAIWQDGGFAAVLARIAEQSSGADGASAEGSRSNGLQDLESALAPFLDEVGAAVVRREAPAGDVASQTSFVVCSDMGGSVPLPQGSGLCFDGEQVRKIDPSELGSMLW